MKWSLSRRVEAYLKRSGTRPTAFGLKVARDPRFVFQLRQGRAVRPLMEARVLAFLDMAECETGESPRRRRCRR